LERYWGAPVSRISFEGKVPAKKLAQIGDTDRIEFVQRAHWPIRIPPLRAKPIEAVDLNGIDRCVVVELFLAGDG
jgi:hypothetical protein